MDIAKITNDFRLSEWLQVMKEHKVSGMTVNNFCNSRGIRRHSFYYWQRKLREAASSEISERTEADLAAPSGWLQLKQENDSEDTIEVTINGFSINVSIDTNPELLKKVCSILRTVQ